MEFATTKNFRRALFATGMLAILGICTGIASADIAPEMYIQLKQEAAEVLQVRITKVTRVRDEIPGVWSFRVEGQIAKVERSKAGYDAGDTVEFESWYVTPATWRSGFSGPQSPPLLQAGWQGRIYLGPSEMQDGLLAPAAYGKSFEPIRSSGTTAQPRPAGTSTPSRPSQPTRTGRWFRR